MRVRTLRYSFIFYMELILRFQENAFSVPWTMDHECCYQDVLWCHNCDTLDPPQYCDICHVHLCINCGGKHFSDASTEHTMVVPFKSLEHAIKCQKHLSEICEHYCEQCEMSCCVYCANSSEHLGHQFVEVEKKLAIKKLNLQKDLQELEKSIYPVYQKIASNIPVRKAELDKNSQKLTTAISKHGEDLQREINTAIEKMKADVIEIKSKQMAVLDKHEDEIKRNLFEIKKSIAEVKKLLDSEDVCHVTAYKSRNAEFNKLSPETEVSLPSFTPQKITKENINQFVGSLSSHLISPLIDEARVITDINIKSGDSVLLTSVSCLSDTLIWTCSMNGNIMLLYDLLGKLVKSVRTKSGRKPEDIAVTKNGDLVYSDYSDGSVNIVKNTKIHTVARLRDWRPRGVCSTCSGDLLVVEVRDEDGDDDDEQIKVVRYSESTEKTIIQYNNKRQSLPKGVFSNKYISENRNYEVCVSDYRASAVVVFSQAGKRRFTYTGHLSTTKEPFHPCGITTDSQSCILTAEVEKGRIHILDQNGQFLRYIDNCDLHSPWALCVDTRDNLFVTEFDSGKVKKIQYCIK